MAREARVSGPQRLLEIKLDGFRLDYGCTERRNSSRAVSLLTSNRTLTVEERRVRSLSASLCTYNASSRM
jgi:hypothetical protein